MSDKGGFLMKTKHLLFGAAYYSEYLPYDRVDEDMKMMADAGMNTIRIAESTWSTLEPHDGEFDFTHIDKMLTAAGKYGLQVIIGTPTYAIPTWLNKKYPDILAVTHEGPGIYGHRQNMDITHPGYLYHCERIIRTLLEHVSSHPQVIGYQLDNETKSYDTAGERPQKMFVEYLKEKFSDINEFNHRFGLDYWSNRINSWEDFPDVRGTINQSLAGEYHRFQKKLVTDFLQWQADIVREYARSDQFITQNFDFSWSRSHSTGLQPDVDQYQAARCMSVAGADIYHPSQNDLTGEEITVCGNISRSLKKDNYLVLETQAQGNIEWLPYPGQLRLQAYSHIANGSNSVMYWHWHSIHNAIESYWKGVLSHDFSPNPVYREACMIGSEFQKIGAHLKNIEKKNAVGILLDSHSQTGLSQFSLPTAPADSYNHILRSLTDVLYRMNIEFDMVSSCEEDFSSYKVLIVPALYSAGESLLTALDHYVKAGGNLIVTYKSAFSDEYLKIRSDTQPYILKDCLGIHYDRFTYPKDTGLSFTDPSFVQKYDLSPQERQICDWMELVTPDTARIIASYDHPAFKNYAGITVNQYEKGTALYLGCGCHSRVLHGILRDFLSSCGIPIPACSFPVICKKGRNDLGKTISYYFNYSQKEQEFTYDGNTGRELLSDKTIVTGDSVRLPAWDLCIIES